VSYICGTPAQKPFHIHEKPKPKINHQKATASPPKHANNPKELSNRIVTDSEENSPTWTQQKASKNQKETAHL